MSAFSLLLGDSSSERYPTNKIASNRREAQISFRDFVSTQIEFPQEKKKLWEMWAMALDNKWNNQLPKINKKRTRWTRAKSGGNGRTRRGFQNSVLKREKEIEVVLAIWHGGCLSLSVSQSLSLRGFGGFVFKVSTLRFAAFGGRLSILLEGTQTISKLKSHDVASSMF